ncbi:hypothetical protein NDU88_011576 [Pleurodeles waltl]|uniref:Uncharacterized protein n=1 Tax=Pleurodeles waltl TaxID=8319 RepID=A0AAV7S313_PLEWA|nr:hypothetical protein NDU88_011576 [Pleurodeles waltl]
MHNKNQQYGTPGSVTGNNINTPQIHKVKAKRLALMSEQPCSGLAVHIKDSRRQSFAETHQTAPSQSVGRLVQELIKTCWTASSPKRGIEWVLQVSQSPLIEEGWCLQDSSPEEQARKEDLGRDPGEKIKGNYAPNVDREVGGNTDCIINTINNSLLAAVKALTWQSHKM